MLMSITRTVLMTLTVSRIVHIARASSVFGISSSSGYSTYLAGNNRDGYESIPDDLQLQSTVVIHRHGDRAQIAKEFGPNFTEDKEITSFWENRLPSSASLINMYLSANQIKPLPIDSMSIVSPFIKEIIPAYLRDELYTGWDALKAPYGQLTEDGYCQLVQLGRHIRKRYMGSLLSNDEKEISKNLLVRSTNICRTIQSARSLLVGLLDIDCMRDGIDGDADNVINSKKTNAIPTIAVSARIYENMFPQADGTCNGITERRAQIFPDNYLELNFPGFHEIADKIRKIAGYTHYKDINWLTIKEILTCYKTHGIKLPSDDVITSNDVEVVTKLAGFLWGALYNDHVLNRLAIGRFVSEITQHLTFTGKMSIFSGHDSTLVPLLCALGIYDNVWSPYASYISIEMLASKIDTSKKFIRVTYNDKDQVLPNSSSIWCDHDTFMSRMSMFAMTSDEYDRLKDDDITYTLSEGSKDMQETVRKDTSSV